MRINILVMSVAICFCSCNNPPKDTPAENAKNDSIADAKEERVNKIMEESQRRVSFDTVGVSSSGVEILRSEIVENSIGYRNIKVTYKNTGNKDIEGLRLSWYIETVFDKPADLGTSLNSGFGYGVIDVPLKAGATSNTTWDISSRDAKRIIRVWPSEVAFSDNTKWKSTYK